MPRRRDRAVVVLIIAATTVALHFSGPGDATEPRRQAAQPSTATVLDPVGDGWRRKLDITQVRISNGPQRVVIATHLADVRVASRVQLGIDLDNRRTGVDYGVSTRHNHGSARTSFDGRPDCDVRSRWLVRRDVIRLSLPRACLGEPGPLRATVATMRVADEMGDAADWTDDVLVAQG